MASLLEVLDAYQRVLSRAVPEAASGKITYSSVMPSQPNYPHVAVYPSDGPYSAVMGEGQDDTYNIAVAILCGIGVDGSGQRELQELIDGAGARSLRRAMFLAARDRVQGQLAAFGVPHLRVKVQRFDSYGIRFVQVTTEHIGAIIRTQAVTWAVQQPGR